MKESKFASRLSAALPRPTAGTRRRLTRNREYKITVSDNVQTIRPRCTRVHDRSIGAFNVECTLSRQVTVSAIPRFNSRYAMAAQTAIDVNGASENNDGK